MSKAAGILFVSGGKALFLRRAMTAHDCAGCWDFPGGGQEGDETSEETAIREAEEEIGFLPKGMRVLHTRTNGSPSQGVASTGAASPALPVPPGAAPVAPLSAVDFTTYLQRVDEEFTPKLNDEHDGWAWAPIATPPEPLHPGCRVALDRISMDELGVARAIAEGRLASPQRYENIWLFAIRITGTDVAFRPKAEEFVMRKVENYTESNTIQMPGGHSMPEFLARCNGLPVVWHHPTKAILDGKEFVNRIVGTVFLPYIAGDEVWAVAKIFVNEAAEMMNEGGLSTSPGVNFANFSVNAKLTLEDGSKVLIEGKPSLFDHVAICNLGVWDKGGDPSGIRSESREDSAMTEAELKAKKDADETAAMAAKKDADEKAKVDADEKAKADADAGKALDKTLSSIADSLASMHKRMDAFEEADKSKKDASKKDGDMPAELAAQDKAKKDAEEAKKADADEETKKEEAKKADAAKKDAEEEKKAKQDSADIRRRIDEVARMIPKDTNDDDYHKMADAQAVADDVFTDFGKRAPRPLQGENVQAYERRCVRMLREHSPTWKASDVNAFADDAFGIVRDQVYAEARATAKSPVNVPAGQLRMVEKRRDGHIVREFYGEPRTWMDPMAGATQLRGEGAFKIGNLGSNSN